MEGSGRLRHGRVLVASRTTRSTVMPVLPVLGSRALGGWTHGESGTSHCIRHGSGDLNLETRRCGWQDVLVEWVDSENLGSVQV
jgi:hypothetical protein